VRRLVRTAYVERWWVLLLNDDGTQLPTLPPIEMPTTFGESEAERVAQTLASILSHLEIPTLVLVRELPRTPATEAAARASTLSAALRRLGAPALRQILVHRGGVVELWRP
jgi:hypothetical protein